MTDESALSQTQQPKVLFSKYSRSKIPDNKPKSQFSGAAEHVAEDITKKEYCWLPNQLVCFGVSRNYAHGDLLVLAGKNTIYSELSVLIWWS